MGDHEGVPQKDTTTHEQAALQQQQIEMLAALNDAAKDRTIAKSEAESSRRLREQLEIDHAYVVAERKTLAASRRSLDEEKAIHLRQISLLLRATDDEAGLELRPVEKTFKMNAAKMTADEQEVYKMPWAMPLIEMARRIAETLDRMRGLILRLAKREQDVDNREGDIAAKEASFAARAKEHKERVEAHRAAVSALEVREKHVDALEKRANSVFENSASVVRDAQQSENLARRALALHEEWFEVVEVLRAKPGEVSVLGGRIHISPNAIGQFPEKIYDLIDAPAPHWVQKIVSERHLMFNAQLRANKQEQVALNLEQELEHFLSENKMTLSREQERSLAVAKNQLRSIEAFQQGMGR